MVTLSPTQNNAAIPDHIDIELQQSKTQLETELADARLLQQLSMELVHEDRTAGLYQKIMDAAVAIMRSQYASMQMLEPEPNSIGKLRLLASSGFTQEAKDYWEWVSTKTDSSCGAALRASDRVVIPDFASCEFMQGTETLPLFLSGGILAAQSTPLFSRSGKLLGMISTHWDHIHNPSERDLRLLDILARQAADLIERNQTAEALKQSEERLRALTTATSDVIYRMNPDWTRMYQLDGRDFLVNTGEPISGWLEKYVHPTDHQRVTKVYTEAIRTKSVFQLEHQVVKADGTTGWTFSRAVPIFDNNGEIVEWFGAASDVTARKRTEEALRIARDETEKRKRLYEAVTASTPDLIYVFDLNYRFTYANEALLKMWGRTWGESIGKGLLELGYEPWHAEMHEREIDEVVRTKKQIRGEVSFPHASLGRRVYDYIFGPVINGDGEVEAVAGTTRDITELKLAEEVRKSLLTQLEKRVEERTKELQRSNEDLQQFAHVASHDLKEPVRKIKLFANRLQEEVVPSNKKSALYVERILSSAERMSMMIEGVLTYSTLNGSQQYFELVDLNEIVSDIQNDLEIVIQEKEAVIISGKLPQIQGTPVLLYQLFYNLINNSLKFSKPGQPSRINITARSVSRGDADYIEVSIADNGIGFEPVYNNKIFETFTRLNSRDKFEGTGLGLSLCKKIAERHHGTIEARGEIDNGSTFVITLPLNQN